jgi:NADH-quinone oxidoreductase subunit L
MLNAVYAIVLLPLVGFAVLLVGGRRLGEPASGRLATVMVALSFVATCVAFAGLAMHAPGQRSVQLGVYTWMPVGGLHVRFELLVDPLSLTMATFVTGISALIHLYSIGYMRGDPRFSQFFLYLNLFVFSMLVLVLSGNLLFTFLGWEGVGVCSYFLVAFWFERDSAATAGKKAFVMNRVGDFGFLLAMFLIFSKVGSLNYLRIDHAVGSLPVGTVTAVALLLFLGAVGKSAQIPLYPWLADAMEGPTPVSALIHAATMVTAGVYLMCRAGPLLERAPDAATTVAIVGVATAFVAGTIASTQSDIKKVLAYSTVSQLGYMMLGVGVGAYIAAIFLMITHAFYKALLFLGAGSVIHSMADEQNIKVMGNLRKYMPITYVTFLVAWLSIAGFPPFSGFWSKGAVLDNAFSKNEALWVVGAVTVVLTAYYIGREVFLVFFGEERWREAGIFGLERAKGDGHGGGHGGEPHESPPVMWVPLVVLAVLATFGGLLDLPVLSSLEFLTHWLAPVFGSVLYHPVLSTGTKVALGFTDAVLAAIGMVASASLWRRTAEHPRLEPNFLVRAWRLDDLYDVVFGHAGWRASDLLALDVEQRTIDGIVGAAGHLVRSTSTALRRVQTGYVRNYALVMAGGAVAVLAWFLARAGV